MRKKIITIVSIFILVSAAIIIPQTARFPISVKLTVAAHSSKPPLLIAHRGFSCKYPENTLPAFKAAIEKGYYGCEFDIHATKDGKWVINHNASVDGMTNGKGKIADMTYDEILSFDVDAGNGIKNFNSLHLSGLEESLELFQNAETLPFIEIKGYKPEAIKDLIRIVEKYGLIGKAVIISFNMDALSKIREENKDIKLMYLSSELTHEDVDICIENGNIGVDINSKKMKKSKDALKYAKEHSLDLAAWTLDSTFEVDYMHFFGINKITTNRIIP